MPRRKRHEIPLEGIAGKLGAEVYNESPGFICILPGDVHESVVGRGASVAEAVDNWDIKLQAHLRNAEQDDPVILLVKTHLAKESFVTPFRVAARSTWTEGTKPQHVIDFENQFYSAKSRRK